MLAVWLVLAATGDRVLWAALGAAATVLVAAGSLGGRDRGARVALALLAGTYAAQLLTRRVGLQASAPVFGAALLLCGELSALAARLRGARQDRSLALRWTLAGMLAVAFAGVIVGGLALGLAAALRPGRSLAVTALGAAAAAAAIWLLALLARWVR